MLGVRRHALIETKGTPSLGMFERSPTVSRDLRNEGSNVSRAEAKIGRAYDGPTSPLSTRVVQTSLIYTVLLFSLAGLAGRLHHEPRRTGQRHRLQTSLPLRVSNHPLHLTALGAAAAATLSRRQAAHFIYTSQIFKTRTSNFVAARWEAAGCCPEATRSVTRRPASALPAGTVEGILAEIVLPFSPNCP